MAYGQSATALRPEPPIPVQLEAARPGYVSLVIEDEAGRRVRSLVAAQHFEAGLQTVLWDGMDEGTPVYVRPVPGYHIQRRLVAPGNYRVRGLQRDAITLTYDFTIIPMWRRRARSPRWSWPALRSVRAGSPLRRAKPRR